MSEVETGMAYLQRLIRSGAIAPMHHAMGIEIVSVSEGQAEVSATPKPEFYNHQGRVHGGFLATLIDSTLGIAVQTRLPGGKGFGTIELKVTYVRKLDEQVGKVVATAHVIHVGRTLLTAEARVAGADGKLYAHGSGTFMVYPA